MNLFAVVARRFRLVRKGSLTTEYPANGSFSDHTHAVCIKLTQVDVSDHVGRRKFEFLMVKLLRVYGECLGARSR
jgi:hypothetical protein